MQFTQEQIDRIDRKFIKRVNQINNLTSRPTDEQLLYLYGAYKQATVGDNPNEEPYRINFKAHSKWKAWNERNGTDTLSSKIDYIKKANIIFFELSKKNKV